MKILHKLQRLQSGATLIEVLVAIGMSAILLPALATGLAASREGRAQEGERLQASALLREADEAVRSIREKGWSYIATNGTYKPVVASGAWGLVSGTETVGSFTRQIVITDVQRNSSGTIVASGGTLDPATKKVTTTVSWLTPLTTSISTETYFSRYLSNATITHTSQADFDAGTDTNTAVTNTAGGEVQLATGGSGSWASPTLAGVYDGPSTYDGNDVWSDGTYAYIGDNTSLQILNVSNPAAPTLLGTYTVGVSVEGVTVAGNYAYIATADDAREFIAVNITNKSAPTLAKALNLGDTQNATSIYVSGSYAYVGKINSSTAGINELYIVNITTPTSASITGSFNLTSGRVNAIYVSGNYAYLATDNSTSELTVVNVTNKASPTSAGVYNTSGGGVMDIYGIGTTLYLGATGNVSAPEFYIINAANPAAPSLVGTYDTGTTTGATISGVAVTGTTAFLCTIVSAQQLTTLNIATPASPAFLGAADAGDKCNDIFVQGNYAYLASQHDTRELEIYTSGGASGYQSSGTFESATMDAGATVAFNYLTFTTNLPASTNIQFQIATNTNNATWNYVGPDGTASTYYTAPGAVPLSLVSGRYLRYKANFSGPGTSTPVLSDTTVNYSP